MLKAVLRCDIDRHQYSIQLPSSALLSLQMFRRTVENVWPGFYQVIELSIVSEAPFISEKFSAMSEDRQRRSLHDQSTRVITLEGIMIVAAERSPFRCICTVHDSRGMWEPATSSLRLNGEQYDFTFVPEAVLGGVVYVIRKASGDAGPQPSII